ncbi:MAG: hypothetical protein Kow0099_27250 [Candidatus Abyssubacteria bacterium]
MYLSYLLLAAAFLWTVVPPAPAHGSTTIELGLSNQEIHLGAQAILTVNVIGQTLGSEPDLPEVEGLDIIFRGQSQNVQIVNMNVRTSTSFRYVVLPHRTGRFTIGPARIQRGGATYESNTVTLNVVESQQTTTSGPADSQTVLVDAAVDTLNPYVGQQITLLFRFARKADAHIRNAGYTLPELPDFWTEGVENKREYSQTIDGQQFLVAEIAVPLFPIREGEVTIDRIMLRYDELLPSRFEPPALKDPFGRNLFDDDFFKLFRTEDFIQKTAYTKPIRLSVRPLPHAGKPDGFKGGVGSFSMTARLSQNEVKAGESVTLTIVLSGEGNVRDLPDPDPHVEGVKIYSDTPSVSVKNYNDTIVGEKVYKVALVPQRAGDITISNLSIPYFNPETERYETASAGPLTLKVLPSGKETLLRAMTTEESDRIGPDGPDILPIHERIGPVTHSPLERWLRRLRPIAYPLPALLYAVCLVIARHRERMKTDAAYRRSRQAAKTAEVHTQAARNAFDEKRWDDVFAECSRAVTEYLADKCNMPAAGITASEVESVLSSRKVSKDLSSEITQFLHACDFNRFTSSAKSPAVAQQCIDTTLNILKRLEQEEAMKQ